MRYRNKTEVKTFVQKFNEYGGIIALVGASTSGSYLVCMYHIIFFFFFHFNLTAITSKKTDNKLLARSLPPRATRIMIYFITTIIG